MSRFKAAVQNDIKSVFLNALEFADLHDINDQEILCVVDSDILKERNAKTYSEYAEGVNLAQLVVYVATEDLNPKPVRGELFFLDGERYIVEDIADQDGVLAITIGANQS